LTFTLQIYKLPSDSNIKPPIAVEFFSKEDLVKQDKLFKVLVLLASIGLTIDMILSVLGAPDLVIIKNALIDLALVGLAIAVKE